jgi:hypothetical protein
VLSTHCGMAVNAEVYELLDAALHPASGQDEAAGRRSRVSAVVRAAA